MQQRVRLDAPAPAAGSSNQDLGRSDRKDTIFAIATTVEAMQALEADWNGLFERAGHGHQIFQTFAWCWLWARHYVQGNRRVQLVILTARRGGRLVMLWPMVLVRSAGLSRLKFMGEPVSQYGDILVEAGPEATDLARAGLSYLTSYARADIAVLDKVRADSVLASLLASSPRNETLCLEAPSINITGVSGYDTIEARFSHRAVRNRRRQMRRLEEQGCVEIACLTSGAPARAAIAEALRMKRAWADARGLLSPALRDGKVDDFFSSAAAATGSINTGVRVFTLKVGGELASVHVGFLAKGRLTMHMLTHEARFGSCGAGALLLEAAVRWCVSEGVLGLDFLPPQADYKSDWSDEVIKVRDYTVPVSPQGYIYQALELARLRERVKAVVNALPTPVRQKLIWAYTRFKRPTCGQATKNLGTVAKAS